MAVSATTDSRTRKESTHEGETSSNIVRNTAKTVARNLGWFSIALGAIEILHPKAVSKFAGLRSSEAVRLYGFRELLCGIGILASKRPAAWLWARAAGDVVDLAHVGMTVEEGNERAENRAMIAAISLVGILLADVGTAGTLAATRPDEG